jgi:hypothetical protein
LNPFLTSVPRSPLFMQIAADLGIARWPSQLQWWAKRLWVDGLSGRAGVGVGGEVGGEVLVLGGRGGILFLWKLR